MTIPAEQLSPYGPRVALRKKATTPSAQLLLAHRQQDRSDGDDADAELLPVLCRFNDLQNAGICSSWRKLRRLVEQEGFPPGKLIGARTRAWEVSEIRAWLDNRPAE
jgi:hypothetical protein